MITGHTAHIKWGEVTALQPCDCHLDTWGVIFHGSLAALVRKEWRKLFDAFLKEAENLELLSLFQFNSKVLDFTRGHA